MTNENILYLYVYAYTLMYIRSVSCMHVWVTKNAIWMDLFDVLSYTFLDVTVFINNCTLINDKQIVSCACKCFLKYGRVFVYFLHFAVS